MVLAMVIRVITYTCIYISIIPFMTFIYSYIHSSMSSMLWTFFSLFSLFVPLSACHAAYLASSVWYTKRIFDPACKHHSIPLNNISLSILDHVTSISCIRMSPSHLINHHCYIVAFLSFIFTAYVFLIPIMNYSITHSHQHQYHSQPAIQFENK
jgi:hypothetical protein